MSTATETRANLGEIKRGIALLCPPLVELRIINTKDKIESGYLKDFSKLADAAYKASNAGAKGVYYVLNEILPDCYYRSPDAVQLAKTDQTTKDDHITRRRYIYIDVDFNHKVSGISSTDDEHSQALDLIQKIKEYLLLSGIPKDSIIVTDSGNGGHILIRIDLPNDDDTKNLIINFLAALKAKFNTDNLMVDQTVFNAARIMKAYGTVARKGGNLPERPHRLSIILETPENITIAPIEPIKAIADTAPKPEPIAQQPRQTNQKPFDAEAFLIKNGVQIRSKSTDPDGTKKLILEHCVFDESHNGTSAAAFIFKDGSLGYKCQHNHCADKHWSDVREKFEPGYRDKNVKYDNNNKDSICIYPESEAANTERNKNVSKSVTKGTQTDVTRNISIDVIRGWVEGTNGWWTTDELDKELGINSTDNKTIRRVNIFRLKEQGLIEQHLTQNKMYRRIIQNLRKIDFKAAGNRQPLSVRLPFGLENLVNVFPGNIIVIAGAPNAGKTAWLLNLVKDNMFDFGIYYFSSEMGESELANRLEKFEDIKLEEWHFTAEECSANFSDAIRPDSVNIIDYLEMTKDVYLVADHLKAIHDRLGTGIAVIALQKKINADLGRGGEFSLEKPRLYLSMDAGIVTIQKAKNWARPEVNPNKLKINFKLVAGCKFVIEKSWHKEDGTEIKDDLPPF